MASCEVIVGEEKVSLGKVDVSLTFLELLAKATKALKTEVTAVSYKDEDGDVIAIKTNKNLEQAIKDHNKKILFLDCIVAKGGAGRRRSPSPAGRPQGTVLDFSLFDQALSEISSTKSGAKPPQGTVLDLDLFASAPGPSGPQEVKNKVVAEESDESIMKSLTMETCPVEWVQEAAVGSGSSGTVYRCRNKANGSLLAVKEFHADQGVMSKKELAATRKEIDLLRSFEHDNIVKYIGTQFTQGTLYILMEYVDGGTLEAKGKDKAPSEETCKEYTRHILAGLEYLHRKGVIHRDIKGGNLLVTKSGQVKLSDFGASSKMLTAQTVAGGVQTKVGTPLYMAPELILGKGYGRKSDIWSLGCSLVEILSGELPWKSLNGGNDIYKLMHRIASTDITPELPAHLSKEAKHFVNSCFNRDPNQRPDVAKLLAHPWLFQK